MKKTRIPIEYVTTKMKSYLDFLEDSGFISKRTIRGNVVITWNDRFTKFMNRFGIYVSFGPFLLNPTDLEPLPHCPTYPYSPFSPPSPTPLNRPSPIAFDHFIEWWKLYPRKVNKAYGLECWNRAMPKFEELGMTWELLKQRTLEYAESWKDTPADRIPHPSTWLNQMRWTEAPENLPQTVSEAGSNPKASKVVQLLEQTLERLTGMKQRPSDLEALGRAAASMSIAYTMVGGHVPEVSYHTVSHLHMSRKYCEYLLVRYDGFDGLTANMLGPGTKSWQRFIVAFQESIGISILDGGLIHCAGEKWTILLNGKSSQE